MYKIAIVDDHEILRNGISDLINDKKDYSIVLEAENGLDLLNRINPKAIPDVFLVDVEMPVMDGPSTVKKLRRKYGKRIKILGLSSHKEIWLINEMIDNGANGYVSKAATADDLVNAISKVKRNDFYLSKDISLILKEYKNTGLKPKLNDKELAILKLICLEKTNPEISKILNMPRTTINTYRTRMIEKVGAINVVGLVLYAVKHGYFHFD